MTLSPVCFALPNLLPCTNHPFPTFLVLDLLREGCQGLVAGNLQPTERLQLVRSLSHSHFLQQTPDTSNTPQFEAKVFLIGVVDTVSGLKCDSTAATHLFSIAMTTNAGAAAHFLE
jgi:hypothetical protein